MPEEQFSCNSDFSAARPPAMAAPTSTAARATGSSSNTTSRPRRSAYRSTFLVEHHFTGFGQVSASLSLLTWLAAKTKTLRLGTAVLVLPWHNPVLVAEQAATHRSSLRRPARFRRRQGLPAQRIRRLLHPDRGGRRAVRRIARRHHQGVDDGQRFSHHGKYWNFEDIVVEPPTAQKPHPPMWMGAGSPEIDPQGRGARL